MAEIYESEIFKNYYATQELVDATCKKLIISASIHNIRLKFCMDAKDMFQYL